MRKLSRDSLPHLVQCGLELGRGRLDTCLTQVLAAWWNIDLRPGCAFFGVPLFRRFPSSSIIIGRDCRFRSATWSNTIGINRACSIVTLREGSCIRIGAGSGLSGTVIAAASEISLGEGVMCGANVTITDFDWHSLDSRLRGTASKANVARVRIADNVWLGLNVTVLKGVEIGARTVIAANSTVTKSLPSDVLAAGSPAVVIRELPQ